MSLPGSGSDRSNLLRNGQRQFGAHQLSAMKEAYARMVKVGWQVGILYKMTRFLRPRFDYGLRPPLSAMGLQ